MKFKLKEAQVTVRGETFTIRELTHRQRTEMFKAATDDKTLISVRAIEYGVVVEPKFTEDDVFDMPGDVMVELSRAVMILSGLIKEGKPDEKDADKKESDAGPAV